MKFKGTAVFGTLVLGFLAYVYFVEIKQSEKEETLKQEQSKIFAMKQEDVSGVKIEFNRSIIELKKSEKGDWTLTTPVLDLAEAGQVNGLLTSLLTEKTESVVVEDGADLAVFGLKDPKGKVSVTSSAGATTQVSVGGIEALGGRKYLKIEGSSKIFLATGGWDSHLAKTVKELRDKRVNRLSKENLKSIRLLSPGQKTALELKKNETDWTVVGGEKLELDKSAINGFVDQLFDLKATDVAIDEKLINSQKGQKFVQVDFEWKDGAKFNFWATPPKDGRSFVFVSDRPQIYDVANTSVDPLKKEVADFRDKKKPFEFARDQADGISIKTSLMSLELAKKDEKWEPKTPVQNKEVDVEKVSSLLDKMSSMRVEKFIQGANLKSPKGEISIKNKAGEPILDLKWGDHSSDPKIVLVKTNKSDEVFGVDATLVSSLPTQTLLKDKDAPQPEKKEDGHKH